MPADDHQRICETIYQYAYGIDDRDWDLYRSIFADKVAIDFTSYRPGRPAATMAADVWVGAVRTQMTGLAATHHAMTNPVLSIDGDRATCLMYIQADHALDHGNDDAWFSLGGHYRDTLVRTAEGWRIDAVTLTVRWRRGDESIMTVAAQRGARRLESPAPIGVGGGAGPEAN